MVSDRAAEPARHRIVLSEPAGCFNGGFPLGNGRLGAVVHGAAGLERFDLNLDTLWSGGPSADDTGGSAEILVSLRDAVRAGRHSEADALARQMQGPGYTQSYQPLGWFEWNYHPSLRPADTSSYHRELDLARATAATRYTDAAGAGVELNTFISAPDQVLVAMATGLPTTALPAPKFHSDHPDLDVSFVPGPDRLDVAVTGRVPAHVLPNYVAAHPAIVYDPAPPGPDGTVAAGMGFAVAARVQYADNGSLRLMIAAADGFRGWRQRPLADAGRLLRSAVVQLDAAESRGDRALLRRHEQDYRQFFDRVDLDLSASRAPVSTPEDEATNADPAAVERFFDYGRYLLISSSRPGTQPANLQGIWNQDVRPGWSCNYTTNINVEMNYWPAGPAALAEMAEPMEAMVRQLALTGQSTAKSRYGARGWAAHHNTDIWRFTAPVNGDPQYANWPTGGLWLTAQLWDLGGFNRSGSGPDLRPILAGAAAFAEDMLVPGVDGRLVFSPSTSPEHKFAGDNGYATAVTEGAALDQELVREIFTRYLCADDSGRHGSAPLTSPVGAALLALRPVQVGACGELLEWYDDRVPVEPGHRHLSHLYGLFPGSRLDEMTTPEEFGAARRALQLRLDNGGGYTGWSQAWILCLAARLRDARLVEHSMAVMLNTLTTSSLLALHPVDDRPSGYAFQIDGNFGAAAGIMEALVQSQGGVVRVLPALPDSWPTGTVRGIRCRGGHTAGVAWEDGMLREVSVTAGQSGDVTLCMPAGAGTAAVRLYRAETHPAKAGSAASVSGKARPFVAGSGALVSFRDVDAPNGRRRVSWSAKAGVEYTLLAQPACRGGPVSTATERFNQRCDS